MDYPYTSIIIPACNAQKTLQLCLDSIMALNYPRERIDVILVNNNSTDNTEQIARQYPITVLQENKTQSSYASRNRGAEAAKGSFLVFTDSDCIATPTWLSNLLENHKDNAVGIFAGEILSYSQRSLLERYGEVEVLNQKKFLSNEYMPYVVTANMAVRRELFEEIGRFNGSLISGGDADLCWRLQKETGARIQYVQDAIVFHKHRNSIRSLYGQYRKYGYGVYYLQKLHPNAYPSVSTYFWRKDVQKHFKDGCQKLWQRVTGKSKQDPSLWIFPFLRALCFFGLLVGRAGAILNERYGKR